MPKTKQLQKVNKTSADQLDEKMKELHAVIPEAFAENRIDWAKLKATLGDEIDFGQEKYGLSWAGKSDAFRAIRIPATGTLVHQEKESKDWDKTENLFIEGDNLEVLKLLQKRYREQIKMIYIDPPYNTGKDFVYKDNFTENISDYYERTGQSKEGIKMTSNLESNGRYHSDWLTMMYPRLFLAHNLLREDGVIFISIDDNEVANLKLILNEIFGEDNFIAEIVWQTTQKNDPKFIAINHEYILVYAKSIDTLKNLEIKWRIPHPLIQDMQVEYEKLKKKYNGDVKKIQEVWSESIKNKKFKALKHYKYVDNRGVYFAADISDPQRTGPKHEFVIHPITHKICVAPSGGYSPREQEMRRRLENNEIHFGPTHEYVVCYKKYLNTAEDRISSVYYEDGRRATRELEKLMGKGIFEHPKSEILLSRLMKFITKDNDLILDFFAGSGTTAHAVMDLNAEDGGNRKWICAQLPEATDEKSEAYKAGYKTISEIGRERIRRAGKKIGKGDIGFKALALQKSNYRQWNVITDKDDEKKLKEQMKLFVEKPLVDNYDEKAVVYEILVKEGFDLNAKVEEKKIGKLEVWSVSDSENKMIVSFAKRLTHELVNSLGLAENDIFVCLDSALDDTTKVNLGRNLNIKVI